jgi:protein-L-isoaspartate(D-aspartate) O-methyltransferase
MLGVQQVKCVLRDGFNGLIEYAPYDKILVTAGAISIPESLKAQLKIGGSLVIPIGAGTQEMYRITRKSEDIFQSDVFGSFRFVPFVAGIHRKN